VSRNVKRGVANQVAGSADASSAMSAKRELEDADEGVRAPSNHLTFLDGEKSGDV